MKRTEPGVQVTDSARDAKRTYCAAAAERIEADAWTQLQLALPEEFKQRMGVEVHRYSSATALVTARSNTLAVNRAIGLGFDEPLRAEQLDSIIDVYRAADAERFLVQWSPYASPADTTKWLLERGFRVILPTVKFVRGLTRGTTVPPRSELRVEEIGPEHGDLFERTVAAPLGVPPELGPGIRSTIGHPGWRFYLAFDGDRAVGGAAMYAKDDCAWCGLAATAETDRARGAQSALLARRIADAANDGCEWITADTIPEAPDRRNPSYHNMLRAGFDVLYERPNYMRELRQPAL